MKSHYNQNISEQVHYTCIPVRGKHQGKHVAVEGEASANDREDCYGRATVALTGSAHLYCLTA